MKKVIYSLILFLIPACILLTESRSWCETPSEPLLGNSKKYDHVMVKKVLTPEIFILETGEKIALIGMNAPPPPPRKNRERDEHGFIIEDKNPTTSLEQQALDFTKDLLEGKYVRLEFDIEQKNDEYLTLAYAFLEDKTFINAEIIKQGYANLKITPPNTKYANLLREAYQEARREKRGLQSE